MKVTMRSVSVVDANTKDLLLHYTVPADRYVEFLKAVDEAALAAGADYWTEVDLGRPNRVMPSEQNRTVIDRAKSPYVQRRGTLSKLDRDILEYLWVHEGEPLYKKEIASALGYTPNQIEYSIRKKLKKHGLVAIGRNVDATGANLASSYYVSKDPTIKMLSNVGGGDELDLSSYDLSDHADVSRMFADVESFYLRRHEIEGTAEVSE